MNMNVYKIRKIPDDMTEELQQYPIRLYRLEGAYGVSGILTRDFSEELSGAIMPFLTKVKVYDTPWDIEKIRKAFNVPDNCTHVYCTEKTYIRRLGESGLKFRFCPDHFEFLSDCAEVNLSNSQLSYYMMDVETEAYVFMKDRVMQWKDNWPLFFWLKKHFLEICGMHENSQWFQVDDAALHMMQHPEEIAAMPELFGEYYCHNPEWYADYATSVKKIHLAEGETLFYQPSWDADWPDDDEPKEDYRSAIVKHIEEE